jgi:hypothetical protein
MRWWPRAACSSPRRRSGWAAGPAARGPATAPATGRSASWALWGDVAWESSLLFVLYGLWQFAGSFTVMGTSGALPRARWLWDAERVLYLPSETDLQRLILPHPLLVQACNYYYDVLHFPLLGACLIWLYTRHRADYPRIRTTVALFTGISLLIQLITVAPPRLLASTGMVDTAVRTASRCTPGAAASTRTSSRPCPRCTSVGLSWLSRSSRCRGAAGAGWPRPTRAHAARRRGDSQSLLAGRNCGWTPGGPGAGGAAGRAWATFW